MIYQYLAANNILKYQTFNLPLKENESICWYYLGKNDKENTMLWFTMYQGLTEPIVYFFVILYFISQYFNFLSIYVYELIIEQKNYNFFQVKKIFLKYPFK